MSFSWSRYYNVIFPLVSTNALFVFIAQWTGFITTQAKIYIEYRRNIIQLFIFHHYVFNSWEKSSSTMTHVVQFIRVNRSQKNQKHLAWEYSWSSGSFPHTTSGMISESVCSLSLASLYLLQLQKRNELNLCRSPYHTRWDLYDQF